MNSSAPVFTLRDGGTSRTMWGGDELREPRELRVGGGGMTEQVVHQIRVGQVEQPCECALLIGGNAGVPQARETFEQDVQLLHAPPAAPEQTARVCLGTLPLRFGPGGHQCWR